MGNKKAGKGRRSKKASTDVMPSPAYEDHSVNIRKISNGYLVRESHSTKAGYKDKETYHPKKPVIQMPGAVPDTKGKR